MCPDVCNSFYLDNVILIVLWVFKKMKSIYLIFTTYLLYIGMLLIKIYQWFIYFFRLGKKMANALKVKNLDELATLQWWVHLFLSHLYIYGWNLYIRWFAFLQTIMTLSTSIAKKTNGVTNNPDPGWKLTPVVFF